ncbi:hypothetical protein ACROYT_G003922 [Oculina patagonica]
MLWMYRWLTNLSNVENVNGAGNVPVAGNVNAVSDYLDGNVMFVNAVCSRRHLANGESNASRAAASACTGLFNLWHFLLVTAPFYGAHGRIEDEEDDGSSHYLANLYPDFSNDRFSDCHEEFEQETNALEREYFESLEKTNPQKETFAESPTVIVHRKTLSTLEETHFHTYNVTPDRPCSAYLRCDTFMSVAEVFDVLKESRAAKYSSPFATRPCETSFQLAVLLSVTSICLLLTTLKGL